MSDHREVAARPRRFYRDVSGILLLDKPLGLSSNAALQEARSIVGALKAGHAGSLDPLASGLLPVCFGQATKVCGRLLNAGKTYRVTVRLGARTESGDGETQVVERAPVPEMNDALVDAALASFAGEQDQVPPMHSALKYEGKRLYEFARRGESVERPSRRITIHRLERIGRGTDHLEFDVRCSKGTYVRTLAADIAVRLGTIGYVESLRRLSIDPFDGCAMHTLEELSRSPGAQADRLFLPADLAFADLVSVQVSPECEKLLLLGQNVSVLEGRVSHGQFRAYGASGRFLGLVEGLPDGRVKPVRLFVTSGGRPA